MARPRLSARAVHQHGERVHRLLVHENGKPHEVGGPPVGDLIVE
jgi:hypothetical protein